MSDPFHIIKAVKNTPVFIFGDHASKYIPAELDDLGLTGDDLTRHIAWDIGTETVIRHLCDHFGCAGQLAAVSRLVIDLNRDPDAKGLIPTESDGTNISGNANLSEAERQDRIDRFYAPYHTALGQTLDTLDDPLVLSIHSFTPKPDLGEHRFTDIGLLVKHDELRAKQFREMFMRLGRNFTIGMNEPYSAYDLNYTVNEHVAPRGLRHLAIEIRQDHIDTDDKAHDIASVLADRLEMIVNRANIMMIETLGLHMLATNPTHLINGHNMFEGYPEGMEQVQLGMGCFWGAERILWKLDGVYVTSVGYAGGHTTDPDYKKTCTGMTGHAEMVHVVFDPTVISFDEILKVFFENHDPTQGNRQGNDTGPQYRSAIFTYSDEQAAQAKAAMARYETAYGRPVTTELREAPTYYPAEDYHQQYLKKNPQGYCMHGPTGIVCHLPERA